MRRLAGILLFLCLGAAGVVWTALRLSLAVLDGTVAVAGLSERVTIERDAYGVPTVTAATRRDLALATGFLHAQDRFFQMDLLRRVAAGELSALVGPAALERDRTHRLHRFRAAARRRLSELPAAHRSLLEAYAQGVNAGLEALAARPFEYLVLRSAPEPWLPEDTVLVNFAMYFDLNDEDASREASYALLHDSLPRELVAFLLPEGTHWDAPLIGPPIDVPPVPVPEVCDLRRPVTAARAQAHTAGLGALLVEEPMAGSNGWAVAAERSRTGRAVVANDMHLELSVPNIWYRIRWIVDAGESGAQALDAAGITLPGAPVLIAGSNGDIAWGFTNSYGDWSDLVLLEPDGTDPRRYRTPSGSREIEEHVEIIEVRGQDPVEITIESTIFGPVLDTDRHGRKRVVHWLAHEPAATNLRLLDLERARDVGSAVRIAHTIGAPPQNIMLADRNGDIAWTIMGRLPRRAGYDPRLPASWAAEDTGWVGWLAPDEYPVVTDPAAGYLWTANARPADGKALDAIGRASYALGARAQQIRDQLAALEHASINDMLAIQLDDRALVQQDWRDLLVAVLRENHDDGRRAALLTVLEDWDGRARPEAAGYRLAREFRERTANTLLAQIVFGCGTANAPLRLRRLYQTEGAIWRLVTERPAHLLPVGFAGWDEFLVSMADAAVQTCGDVALAECRWGEISRVEIAHPLARVLGPVSRWLTVNSDPLPGGQHTPRVQDRRRGASERFAVSPGDEANGYFHMPAGQSGHPLSPFFDAGHDAWARGEPLPFLPGAAEHMLALAPASAR